MKLHIVIVVTIATVALFGCGSPTATNATRVANRDAQANGSPFRWSTKHIKGNAVMTRVMIDLPQGSSKADETLYRDILLQIETVESSKQRPSPKVEGVFLLADGREVWVLEHPQDGIAYIVSMKPSIQGGTDFSIDGPHLFQRRD